MVTQTEWNKMESAIQVYDLDVIIGEGSSSFKLEVKDNALVTVL